MEKCWLGVLREMQIKAIVKYHLLPELAKHFKTGNRSWYGENQHYAVDQKPRNCSWCTLCPVPESPFWIYLKELNTKVEKELPAQSFFPIAI